jgi:hypothetical protein
MKQDCKMWLTVRVESALQFYKLIKHKRGQDVTEIVKKSLGIRRLNGLTVDR